MRHLLASTLILSAGDELGRNMLGSVTAVDLTATVQN